MRANPSGALAIGLCFVAAFAGAATEQFSKDRTRSDHATRRQDHARQRNVLVTHSQSHASPVNDKTGEQTSEWCNFDSLLDAKDVLVEFVGYCTRVYDSGDLMWISIAGKTAEASEFTILGGTGRFAGATGGGTTRVASVRGDGREDTFTNVGTLTTK